MAKQEKQNKEEQKRITGEKGKKQEQKKCEDSKCPIHGTLSARGRSFQAHVIKKIDKRIVVEFERIIYIKKYERYAKKKTKLHARLPQCMNVEVGDLVKIRECRPLSKIIHFVVVEKIIGKENKLKK